MQKDKKSNFFSWELTEEELKNQIENYSKLGVFKSYRKMAAGIFLLWIIISLIPVFNGAINPTLILPGLLLYLVLSFFVYKGHKWAIILLIILFSIETIYKVINAYTTTEAIKISSLIWWAIIIPILYKALKVERAKKVFKQI